MRPGTGAIETEENDRRGGGQDRNQEISTEGGRRSGGLGDGALSSETHYPRKRRLARHRYWACNSQTSSGIKITRDNILKSFRDSDPESLGRGLGICFYLKLPQWCLWSLGDLSDVAAFVTTPSDGSALGGSGPHSPEMPDGFQLNTSHLHHPSHTLLSVDLQESLLLPPSCLLPILLTPQGTDVLLYFLPPNKLIKQ